MSVYNGQAYLREAIESILKQTFSDFEFLIVDDGSTDQSRRIVLSYEDSRIRLLQNSENIGLTRSLNRGLEEARADLIARQDADDISYPQRLGRQVAYMEQHPDVVLLGTQARNINSTGRRICSLPNTKASDVCGIKWQLMMSSAFAHTSVMFRKDIVLDAMGGYDPDYNGREDFELWSRVVREYSAANLTEKLVDLRCHSESVTSNYNSADILHMEEIIERNMKQFLGTEDIPSDWPKAITWKNNPNLPSVDYSDRLLSVIHSVWEKFLSKPNCNSSKGELKELLAVELARCALRISRQHRLRSIRPFFHACRTDVSVAVEVAPRYLMMFLLGAGNGRRLKQLYSRISTKQTASTSEADINR